MKYYAVQLGEYWAHDYYNYGNNFTLKETPFIFDSFKDAYNASKKLNGKVVEFKWEEIPYSEIARLVEEAVTNE